MNVFISQPMNGRTAKEIQTERVAMYELLCREFPDERIELIDSWQEQGGTVERLGKSVALLELADLVALAHGYENARSCRVEEKVAEEYHIPMIMADEMERSK